MREQQLRNFILSEMFNATVENDFIKFDDGKGAFIVAGNPLTPVQSSEIIESANQLKSNILFNSILKELQWDAHNRIFNKSTDMVSTEAPKWLLYAVDIIRKKVEKISTLVVTKPKTKKQHG